MVPFRDDELSQLLFIHLTFSSSAHAVLGSWYRSSVSMSEENDKIFQDCFSSAVLERYSTAPRKRMAKRSRKSAPVPTSSTQTGSENVETDPAELAEFIEVIAGILPKPYPECSISEAW